MTDSSSLLCRPSIDSKVHANSLLNLHVLVQNRRKDGKQVLVLGAQSQLLSFADNAFNIVVDDEQVFGQSGGQRWRMREIPAANLRINILYVTILGNRLSAASSASSSFSNSWQACPFRPFHLSQPRRTRKPEEYFGLSTCPFCPKARRVNIFRRSLVSRQFASWFATRGCHPVQGNAAAFNVSSRIIVALLGRAMRVLDARIRWIWQ